MATAMNQHKAMAEGKALNTSPSGVVKFKKGGMAKKSMKHDDVAMDKKLIKGVVKKGCVK